MVDDYIPSLQSYTCGCEDFTEQLKGLLAAGAKLTKWAPTCYHILAALMLKEEFNFLATVATKTVTSSELALRIRTCSLT